MHSSAGYTDSIEEDYKMRTKSGNSLKILMLLLFLCVLGGCSSDTDYEKACDLYEERQFDSAEAYFEAASAQFPEDIDIAIGHGYNLVVLNRNREATDLLAPIFDSLVASDDRSPEAMDNICNLGELLADSYSKLGDHEKESLAYQILEDVSNNAEDIEKYRLENARARAALYKGNKSYREEYRAALEEILGLTAFDGESYVELVESYKGTGENETMLTIADEMIIYMRSRSSYIEDFPSVISAILDAAETARYTEYEHDPEFYYGAAEEFITLAGASGITYPQKLRYKIVIAERKHELDVAGRLLGVYINKCPEDAKAVKEKAFIEARFR